MKENIDKGIILEGRNVIKRFTANAQHEVNIPWIQIRDHDRIGIAGPNGSGKSTILKILSTVYNPDEGVICRYSSSSDLNISSSLLNGENDIYPRLTLLDNLRYFLSKKNPKQKNKKALIKSIIELFEITEHTNTIVGKLSTGNRLKASLACTLVVPARLYILDEPFNGLDKDFKETLIDIIKDINGAVLLTSHIEDTLYKTCNRFFDVSNGLITESTDPTGRIGKLKTA